ncbi:hypothetical protein YH63_007170 [Afipia massiliensis]|uniref:DUF4935 domain-containing protein n=1 Tax=Afipia massiliensis TaxID=211460 RepID=A0A4U6BP34_9BRAD|nr:PIN domain-containing protein [Afipia massiliensis]TKT71205.1 hypothetical protein YH63_007170 [Afipia massiliensis]
MADDDQGELITKYVFIDTEAFVREKLDWQSKTLVGFSELVRAGHLTVISTSITRREIESNISEVCEHALKAMAKYDVTLRLLNIQSPPFEAARSALLEKYAEFSRNLGVVEVPLSRDAEKLFDAYFSRMSPFSEKKKSEFPDAVVLQSLREWCVSKGQKLYVVSRDPDIKTSCNNDAFLIQVESVAEVLSKALVVKKLHDALFEAVAQNDELFKCIRAKLIHEPVKGGSRFDRVTIDGQITDVYDADLVTLNVINRDGNQFQCEVEFEFELEAAVGIEREYTHDPEIYDTYETFREDVNFHQIVLCEIEIEFEPSKTDSLRVLSVYLGNPRLEISASDLSRQSRYFR